ncbi:MAG TPA: DeoR/GlpR transcriptional regulator [Desulfobulbaceae bacterium]|nr:DeoR/GlpR transcriptional regulator [Desulfobulbaceae bacterium]
MKKQSENIIPEQRRALVLGHIQREGVVSVQKVAQLIGTSVATVRRDFAELANRGMIVRIHGGAMLALSQQTTFEPDYHFTSKVFVSEKEAIGKVAAELLQPRQSVLFDSSSTVFQAARFVVERGIPILALTNDLNIANALADAPRVELKVTGGSLRSGSFTLVGDPGRSFLGSLHVDVCFLGIHAIALRPHHNNSGSNKDPCATLSDTSLEVVAMKRQMVRAARKKVVLVDSSKFGISAFCDVCTLDYIDIIITDRNIQPDQQRCLERNGIQVIIADQEKVEKTA